ncbi:MAG: phosphate ABC transporter permease PstA [Oscillospiraceae bacterium]|nr:phosphate ABC transporter permease PstA [Oscillospiraceae bacterium]
MNDINAKGTKAINKVSFSRKLRSYSGRPLSLILFILMSLAAVLTGAVILLLIGYILIMGIPRLSPRLFELKYNSENVSMLPAIINTFTMTICSMIIAVPTGIFAAIYLTEYAKKGSKIVRVIRVTAETLSGIPSIIYGLFGYLMFVIACHFGNSMLAGALTLSIMILPTILRTTEEALMSVPDSFREGSFGLGAGKLRTVFRVVLPSAVPGILSGVILSMGRVVGETAALIYTAGTVTGIPKDIMSSGRTLAVHMYSLMSEGLHTDEAYATAVVLLVMTAGINCISAYAAKKLSAPDK